MSIDSAIVRDRSISRVIYHEVSDSAAEDLIAVDIDNATIVTQQPDDKVSVGGGVWNGEGLAEMSGWILGVCIRAET